MTIHDAHRAAAASAIAANSAPLSPSSVDAAPVAAIQGCCVCKITAVVGCVAHMRRNQYTNATPNPPHTPTPFTYLVRVQIQRLLARGQPLHRLHQCRRRLLLPPAPAPSYIIQQRGHRGGCGVFEEEHELVAVGREAGGAPVCLGWVWMYVGTRTVREPPRSHSRRMPALLLRPSQRGGGPPAPTAPNTPPPTL